jgi:hypothetical protein
MDSGYDVWEVKNRYKTTHEDGDEITENISIHVEYATKRSVFHREYPVSLHSYLKDHGIPLNAVKYKEEYFVDEEIAGRLRDIFASSEGNRNLEYPAQTKLADEWIEGEIDLIDHVNKIVWEYKIKNAPYTLDDRLQLVCYKAMTPNLARQGYEYRLANIAGDKWMVLENSHAECEELMLEAIRRKLQGRVDDETFLKQAERIWRSV